MHTGVVVDKVGFNYSVNLALFDYSYRLNKAALYTCEVRCFSGCHEMECARRFVYVKRSFAFPAAVRVGVYVYRKRTRLNKFLAVDYVAFDVTRAAAYNYLTVSGCNFNLVVLGMSRWSGT